MFSFLKLLALFCILQVNLSTQVRSELTDHGCDTCNQLNKHCKIAKGNLGFYCNNDLDLKALNRGNYESTRPKFLNSLEKCVPNGIVLKENIESFCCTWSEEAGCTLLKPRNVDADCDECAKNKTNSLGAQERLCSCESNAYVVRAGYTIASIFFLLTLTW